MKENLIETYNNLKSYLDKSVNTDYSISINSGNYQIPNGNIILYNKNDKSVNKDLLLINIYDISVKPLFFPMDICFKLSNLITLILNIFNKVKNDGSALNIDSEIDLHESICNCGCYILCNYYE